MWAKKKQTGFTIVELLIVIVVIAILAAITVAAYNGATTRAENTKTTTAVAAYARAILMYSQLNDSYPAASWVCLADANNSCGLVSGGAGPCFGLGGAARSVGFDNSILTTVTALPKLSDQTMACSTGVYQGGLVNSPDSTHMNLYFLLRGNQPACPAISGTTAWYRTQQDDATFCAVQFPSL